MRSPAAIRDSLLGARVVPVLRFDTEDQAGFAIDCLLDAGYSTVEITLTTPGALELISRLRSRVPASFTVGAGTIMTQQHAIECIAAGADYLVSPCLVDGMVEQAHAAGCAALLGAFTPSEVRHAVDQGSDIVKVFPASTGGPSHLSALRAVFPETIFCPTGGVNEKNMNAYFAAGARLVGIGNSIIDRDALQDMDRDRGAAHARRFLVQAGV